MTASSNSGSNGSQSMSPDKTSISLIGKPCCQNGQYTFYKAFKYSSDQTKRVLMLGEFFFLRIPPHDDPCIGELQLLWEDRQRNQLLSSTRLYFLPEQSPDGRQSHHGEHEVLAATDKVTLKLTDLVSWITHQMDWIAGLHYHWQSTLGSDEMADSDEEQQRMQWQSGLKLSSRAFLHNQNMMSPSRAAFLTSQRIISDRCRIISDTTSAAAVAVSDADAASTDLGPSSCSPRGLDFNDVIEEKLKANEDHSDLSTVAILSYDRYCRYRSLLKRIHGCKSDLLRQSSVQDALVELGIPLQRNCRVNILFCRDSFEHEGLLNNDLNCDHLTPRLKGKPRRRPVKSIVRGSSPESISSEENSRPVQPRRSRRAIAVSGLVSCAINYSESLVRRNPRKNKQKRNSKRSNGAAPNGDRNSNKKAGNNRRTSKLKPETPEQNSSGNETDSSSVDANNNLTADLSPSATSTVNLELKRKVKSESAFLEELYKFMKKRKTPIQRLPNLGFKKIDLHVFYTHAQNFGGYDNLTKEKLWKKLYDKMGGDRRSTSAATCTRRHYERLLLPFERYLNGHPDDLSTKKKSNVESTNSASCGSKEEDELEREDTDQEHNASDNEAKNEQKEEEEEVETAGVDSKVENISNDEISDQIIDLNDKEQLILKFTPTSTSSQKANKSRRNRNISINGNLIKHELNGDAKSHNLVEDVTINIACTIKNVQSLAEAESARAKKNTSLDDITESPVSVTMVSGNGSSSKSKVTALVHPTQREKRPSDIYDFNDGTAEEMARQRQTLNEILLLKSALADNGCLSSPLHSISTLISQMPESGNAHLSPNSSMIRPIVPDVGIQNSFVRKAFPLPKPLESPNEILLTIKQNDDKSRRSKVVKTCTPLPAHSSSTISGETRTQSSASRSRSKHSNRENVNLKHSETSPKVEILDLSTKKRRLETSCMTLPSSKSLTTVSGNSEENILDLSVKKIKSEKKSDSQNKDSTYKKNGIATFKRETVAAISDGNTTKIDKLTNLKQRTKDNHKKPQPHARDSVENTKAESSNSKRSVLSSSSRESSRHRVEVGLHTKNSSGQRKVAAAVSTGNRPSTSHSPDAHSHTVGVFSGQSPVPGQPAFMPGQPSISEYNPALPAFIRSPSIWPGWPAASTLPISPFTSSPVANTATGLSSFHPAQLFFPGALLPNTSLANPFLGQQLLDPAKVMEAYASPLMMKSLLEQTQMQAGNAFLHHLFSSSQ